MLEAVASRKRVGGRCSTGILRAGRRDGPRRATGRALVLGLRLSCQAVTPPPLPAPPPPVLLSQALKEHPHLAILGEPGTGKTTLLQYVALCFASDAGQGAVRPGRNAHPSAHRTEDHDGVKQLDSFVVQQLSPGVRVH